MISVLTKVLSRLLVWTGTLCLNTFGFISSLLLSPIGLLGVANINTGHLLKSKLQMNNE